MQFIGGITYSGGYSVVPPPGDTQFRYNSLLVSPSTVQSKTTTTTDSSSNALTVTKNSNPSTQWPSPYQSTGYWSGYFNGSSYLSVSSNATFAPAGNFTIEAWAYFTNPSSSYDGIICTGPVGTLQIYISKGDAGIIDGVSQGNQISWTTTYNQWVHHALVCSGSTLTMYINGVSVGSITKTLTPAGTTPIIGRRYSDLTSYQMNGYISNLRFLNGTALYTSTFTVPTAPLTAITNTSLLSVQSNRFRDNSSNNFTITPSGTPQVNSFYPLTTINGSTGFFSGYLNGTTDYLTIPSNSAFIMGTGAFTIECWFNTSNSTALYSKRIINRYTYISGLDYGWALGILRTSPAYTLIFNMNNAGPGDVLSYSGTVTPYVWHHLVVVRDSNSVCSMYLDGTRVATSATFTVNDANTGITLTIGSEVGIAGTFYDGYLSNVRIVKGTAAYDPTQTTITVPTTPLVAITNTSLLAFQNSTFIDNSTNAFAITRNGTPSTNVANPFSSTALTYFTTNYFGALGGALSLTTSDWLSGPGGAPFGFSTGDFTIEMWVYLTTTTGFPTFYDGRTAGGQIVPLLYNNNGTLTLYVGASAVITATMPTANVWHHIALSRNSSSTRLFVDGAQVGSTYSDTNDYITPSSGPTIGKNYTGASDAYGISGYVANYRVIKGTGVYTGAFTPPSMAPLTTAGSTSALSYTSTTNVNTAFAASSTSLLLNFAESNLSNPVFNTGQNNTFLDSGPNSLAITRNGTPTQGSFNPYMPNGYWGGYFNGSTDYLTVPANAAFSFGTGAFTVESWVYTTNPANTYGKVIIDSRPDNTNGAYWLFAITNTGGCSFVTMTTGGTTLTSPSAIPFNQWVHVAATRTSGGTLNLWVNGTSVATASNNTDNISSDILKIGTNAFRSTAPETYFIGNMSNIRIIKGTALYTSTFTVPTAPLTAITNTSLLTLQSNWFKDNSTNSFTITANGTPLVQSFQPFNPPLAYSTTTYGGSGYFGGTSNSLSITSTTPIVLNIGAAPTFTIEFWAYITSASSENVVDKGSQGGSTVPNYRVTIASGVLYLLWGAGDGGTYTAYNTTGYTIPYYTWAHCAIVANNAALTMYINGVSRYSGGTLASYSDNGKPLFISSRFNTDQWFYGYISNLRIVKGTAVYTGAFTPPYLPLATSGPVSAASYTSTTNINTIFPATQCSLLTNFTNGGIYDAVTQNNLTTVDNAQVSTTVVKFGLASLYFDGTGDYIDMVNSQAFIMGSGDFTVEAWVYPTTTNASHWMYLQGNASGFAAIRIGCQSNQAFVLMSTNGSTWTVQSNLIGSVPINTWTYIALTRSSTTVNLYINGSSVYSSSALSTSALMTGIYNIIGRIDPTNLQYFAGYLQDIRLTKGVARYTSTFIVPTEALPLFGGSTTGPGAPTIGTATVLSGSSASVAFTAPWNTGGSPITSYIATSSPGSFTGTSATSPITVSGLTGSSYTFTVAGINSIGTGSSSAASNTISLTDPYYMYVPLLLETGSQSTRSTTVTDGAATPNTVTRNGTLSTGWTSPYQTVGYWSGYFGTTDYFTLPNNTAFAVGTGNFTVECWCYLTTLNSQYNIIFQVYDGTNEITLRIGSNAAGSRAEAAFGPSVVGSVYSSASYTSSTMLNQWVHLALSRNGDSTTFYYNGVVVQTRTGTSAISIGTPVNVNINFASPNYFLGYISNLRLVKGTAVYTGAFTVPTSPLTAVSGTSLLTLQDNRFKDNSTNTFTLTATGTPQTTPYFYPSSFTAPAASTGAGLFNGSSDYLSTPTSTALNLGSSDFTIEAWVYLNSLAANGTIVSKYVASNVASSEFLFWITNTGILAIAIDGAGAEDYIQSSASLFKINVWYHVAVTKSGSGANNVTLWQNGVQVGQGTSTRTMNTTSTALTVGSVGASNYLNGYISNLRIVKGTAVYTGAFTPPSGFVTQTGGTYPSTTNVNTSIPAANTSLLLNLADSNFTTVTNTAQNNNFIDNSNNAFTITRNGTPTQGSLTPYQPTGYWSAYFSDGTNYATIPNSSNLDLSTGDFTVECWFNTPSLRSPNPLIYRFNGNSNSFTDLQFAIGLDNANIGATVYYGNAGNTVASVTGAVSVGVWYHCALVRTGNNFYFYFNGTRYGSLSSASTLSNGAWATYFGFWRGGNISYPAIVSLSNVRIVKGTALYTAATITVPTSPLTAIANTQFLGFQDNRFKDNSTNNFTITPTGTGVPSIQASQPFSPAASYSAQTYGGSGLFNGSTDYLTASYNSAFNFSTNDFTIESWIYPTSYALDIVYMGLATGANNGRSWYLVLNVTTGLIKFSYYTDGTTQIAVTSSTAPTLNSWSHVAVTRASGTTRIFLNGVQVATASTQSGAMYTNASAIFTIGRESGYNGNYFPGYISNVRIINGTAVYTGAFTPPYLPLTTGGVTSSASYTSTTNVNTVFGANQTSLLTNFGNAGIYDAAWQNNAITVADAQVSTTQYQWSPTSMKFDGTLDAISIPPSVSFGLGTADWTIEFWLYFNSVPSVNCTLVSMLTTDSSVAPHIYYAGNSGIRYYTNSADRITGGALNATAWYYIALTKASGSTRMYINGTQTGSTYTDSNNYGTSNPFAVADYRYPLSGGSPLLNGYVQDVRITKGYARTITTPTSPFPTR